MKTAVLGYLALSSVLNLALGGFGAGPFLKDGVQVLKDMGITSIRLGGSFVSVTKLSFMILAFHLALPTVGLFFATES